MIIAEARQALIDATKQDTYNQARATLTAKRDDAGINSRHYTGRLEAK